MNLVTLFLLAFLTFDNDFESAGYFGAFPSLTIQEKFPAKQMVETDSSRKIRRQRLEKPVNFGVIAGFNLSNMNFNKGYSGTTTPLSPIWKPGFIMGLVMDIHLYQNLYLDQEYLYSRVVGGFQPFQARYIFDYLSFPVLLKYQFSPRFSLVVGPQFELLIKGKERKETQHALVTQYTEERNIGITVGMAYLITSRIKLNARFMHGINHVGIYQRTGRREFKYELFQVSSDFKF